MALESRSGESRSGESRSGAGVRAVRTPDGLAAYTKITPATLGPQALAAARRELSFYRELAPVAPVRTPRLLAGTDTDEGVTLLLAAAGEPRPVESWTPSNWADLGRELAALHTMPAPTGPNWIRDDGLRKALTDPDLPSIEAFWAPTLPRLAEILAQRADLRRQMDALPPVFIHGDCHTNNIMHSANTLVFLDWQVSGIGRPGSDLAFLNVRAVPAGITAPPELLDSYLDAHPHERRTIEMALLAEELAVFVWQWPAFAAYNSPTGIDRVRRRTRNLAERWLDTRC